MFWRLFGAYGVLLVTSIGLLGWMLATKVESHHQRQIKDKLHTKAILIRELVRDWPAAGEPLPKAYQDRINALGQEIASRITLLDAEGNGKFIIHGFSPLPFRGAGCQPALVRDGLEGRFGNLPHETGYSTYRNASLAKTIWQKSVQARRPPSFCWA